MTSVSSALLGICLNARRSKPPQSYVLAESADKQDEHARPLDGVQVRA
jgi:hypothetical protein